MNQEKLENKIKAWEEAEKIKIGLYAQSDRDRAAALSWREREIFPAASLIKLLAALATLKKVERGELNLTDQIKKDQFHHLPGASILADLQTESYQLGDLLYFLLAHSDNTAQIILESILNPADIQKVISDLELKDTAFVSLLQRATSTSTITPQNAHIIARAIWEKKYLRPDLSEFLLTQLTKTRNTHFGLRYLPCRLNQADPEITDFYAKSGKLADLVVDQLILKTKKETLFINIFVKGEAVARYRNNVDNRLAILTGEIALEVYRNLTSD